MSVLEHGPHFHQLGEQHVRFAWITTSHQTAQVRSFRIIVGLCEDWWTGWPAIKQGSPLLIAPHQILFFFHAAFFSPQQFATRSNHSIHWLKFCDRPTQPCNTSHVNKLVCVQVCSIFQPNYTSVRLTYLIHCAALRRVHHRLIMLQRIIAVI